MMTNKIIKSTCEEQSIVLSVFLDRAVRIEEHAEPVRSYSLSVSYAEQPKTLNDFTVNAWLVVFGDKRFESAGTIFSTILDMQMEQQEIMAANASGDGLNQIH